MNNNETMNQQEQKPKKKRQYSRETLIKELEKLELIGLTDIAKMLDWNTSKVATYITRLTLPEPLVEISGRPVWHKPEVLKTAKHHKWRIHEDNEELWEDKLSIEERTERRLKFEALKKEEGLSNAAAAKRVIEEAAEAKKHPVGA